MNILLLSWRGPGHPNSGGAEISTHEFSKSWVKAGHKVTLFTSFYSNASKREILDGVEIIRRGDQIFGVHLEALKWYIFENHPEYDLVIDQFHGIPFFTPLYAKIRKLAFIHEVAKEVWQFNQYPFPYNQLVATVGSKIEPNIFRLYKNIPFMTISKSTKNDLTDWGIPQKNITIIYNGVNKPEREKLNKERKVTITYLGALAKDKGIETAIDVFAYLQRNYEINFQYWIIGKASSDYLKFLKKRVEKLRLNKVKFWGYVSERKKFNLLKRSHILINPSIREGWGLVVIEAASVGTPTVAFNVPGLRDSIVNGKTGILCSENSVEDLANKIYQLLTNEKKYNRIRKNAISWSKNFSWKKASQESLKLIESIAG